jgi:hypothetical protein
MGAMVFAGPAARATTTSSAACQIAVSQGIDYINASGNASPNPTTPETVFDDLEFIAAAVGVNTQAGMLGTRLANAIEAYCS